MNSALWNLIEVISRVKTFPEYFIVQFHKVLLARIVLFFLLQFCSSDFSPPVFDSLNCPHQTNYVNQKFSPSNLLFLGIQIKFLLNLILIIHCSLFR